MTYPNVNCHQSNSKMNLQMAERIFIAAFTSLRVGSVVTSGCLLDILTSTSVVEVKALTFTQKMHLFSLEKRLTCNIPLFSFETIIVCEFVTLNIVSLFRVSCSYLYSSNLQPVKNAEEIWKIGRMHPSIGWDDVSIQFVQCVHGLSLIFDVFKR